MHGFKPPFLYQTAIHFAATLTELVNSHYIKTTRTLKNSCFKGYKTVTQSFLSYGSLVQILTENNSRKSKISSQIAVEIKILRSKKE